MKYVLLLSFSYKQYKDKIGELDLKINDRLIDVIKLDQDIGLKQVTFTTRDKEGTEKEHTQLRPEKIFYYEIEANGLLYEDRENKLSISVNNDNNNYTNGFMTDDSLLSIQNIWFLPLALFNIDKIQKIHHRLRQASWNKYKYNYSKGDVRLSQEQSNWIKEFYKEEFTYGIPWKQQAQVKNKSTEYLKDRWLYTRFQAQERGLWPGIVHPLKYKHTSANQKIPNYSRGLRIGGSFEVSLPIKKKHKIYAIRQKNYKGAPMTSHNNFLAMIIEILQGSADCTIINKNAVNVSMNNVM